MLTADNISRIVKERPLVDRVSAAFPPRQLSIVIGPNGAGKSTLIKLLSKQLACDTGRIQYDGIDLHGISERNLARVRAVLSQNIEVSFPLRVWEVVMMGRYPHFVGKPTETDEHICEEVMQFFDVFKMANRDYLTLSGGEKQRVHFARVLSQIWTSRPGENRYLFLDEPLTFLDIYYQFEFMAKLRQLLKERALTVVGVVHDLNLAARYADRILLLHQGRILATGSTSEVLTRENIKAAFRLEPTIVQVGAGSIYLAFK